MDWTVLYSVTTQDIKNNSPLYTNVYRDKTLKGRHFIGALRTFNLDCPECREHHIGKQTTLTTVFWRCLPAKRCAVIWNTSYITFDCPECLRHHINPSSWRTVPGRLMQNTESHTAICNTSQATWLYRPLKTLCRNTMYLNNCTQKIDKILKTILLIGTRKESRVIEPSKPTSHGKAETSQN